MVQRSETCHYEDSCRRSAPHDEGLVTQGQIGAQYDNRFGTLGLATKYGT